MQEFMANEREAGNLMGRVGVAPTETEMGYQDPKTGVFSQLLIFGSNNYLGFANEPEIKEKVKAAIDAQGLGTGGSPAFSGYTQAHNIIAGFEGPPQPNGTHAGGWKDHLPSTEFHDNR